jgi:hypothetical protein
MKVSVFRCPAFAPSSYGGQAGVRKMRVGMAHQYRFGDLNDPKAANALNGK